MRSISATRAHAHRRRRDPEVKSTLKNVPFSRAGPHRVRTGARHGSCRDIENAWRRHWKPLQQNHEETCAHLTTAACCMCSVPLHRSAGSAAELRWPTSARPPRTKSPPGVPSRVLGSAAERRRRRSQMRLNFFHFHKPEKQDLTSSVPGSDDRTSGRASKYRLQ